MTHPDTPSGPSPTPPIRPYWYRPLLPVVMSFCLAIVVAEWSATHPLWAISALVMLAAAGVGLACCHRAARKLWLSVACTLVLGYGYALWSAVSLPANHISHYLVSTPVTLEAQVLRVAPVGPGKTILDLSAQVLTDDKTVAHVSGRVRVTAYEFAPSAHEGDIVRLHRIRLRRPLGFRNPGAFDYGRYLARQGIYATGSISKDERLEVIQRASGVVLARLSRLKEQLTAQIRAAMDADEAAITTEMVLGVRGSLPPGVREAFNASGTVHLLSVSGFHVAAVYGAVFFLLRFLFKQVRFRLLGRFHGGPRPSKLAAMSALAVVIGYACLVTLGGLVDLVDPNFPAIRSTIMITTFVLAYLLDRDGDAFNITLLAAFLILVLDPFALFGIGFQLSFVGILTIFYAHRFLYPSGVGAADQEHPLNYAARGKRWLRDAVVISTFASLGTTPLVLYHFERLPLIAPLANIVVAPLASLAVPSAIVASFTTQILQALGSLLLFLTGILVKSMYAVIHFFAALLYAAPHIGAVSFPVMVLAYAPILLLPYSQRHRMARWGTIGGTITVSLWLLWPWLFPDGRGQLQVTFLDVGHGDATFIRFPHGTTMLIDGGGSYRDDVDIGERVVAPFLRHQRVRRIDYVVATHPHPDHAKGLGVILRDFRVRQFWDNGTQQLAPWYNELRQTAIDQHIYHDFSVNGVTAVTIDGVHLALLHPTAAFPPRSASQRRVEEDRGENNRSLVLKLLYGTISFLFTGDIEQEAERFLLKTGRDLQAAVIKVPHHGSQTSSGEPFVQAVNPRVAVFSVPRDSRFGHPHPAVVQRYRALGAHIFRTDEHGAITIRTDGQSAWIEPYVGEPAMLSAPVAPHVAKTFTPPAAGPR
jgi:competence protein ComEC